MHKLPWKGYFYLLSNVRGVMRNMKKCCIFVIYRMIQFIDMRKYLLIIFRLAETGEFLEQYILTERRNNK